MAITSADSAPKRSPWLSVWFKPGDTIESVLATKPKPYLWLLVAGAIAYWILGRLVGEGVTTAFLDWRFLAGAAAIAAIIGTVILYLDAFFLSWSGWIFGGHASSAQMRAVIAWGAAPLCLAVVIFLVTLAALRLLASDDRSILASGAAFAALSVIGLAPAIWSTIATLVMLKRVQAFGW